MTKIAAIIIATTLILTNVVCAAPQLPINKEEATRIAGGKYITTKLQITDGSPAKLQGTIRCESKVTFSGFTGASLMILKDGAGNIIYRQYAPSIGVNGDAFGGHDRTKDFSHDLPDIIRDNVRSVEIQNMMTPQNPINQIEENAKSVKQLIQRLK